MTIPSETARTPQTFEEWCREYCLSIHPKEWYSGSSLRAAWDAALASQQAELRAAREVVEAAREWLEDWRGPAERGAELELHGEPPAAYVFVAALAAYDRLTTSEDKG